MRQLYFIRHGLSQMNFQNLMAGSTDTPLHPEGISQAEEAGLQASRLNLDLIVSSPLIHALDTAKIIAEAIGLGESAILVNKLLAERNFGVLEGQTWVAGRDLSIVQGIETSEQLIERATEAYNWLKSLIVDNILVVSHGSFGRALRTVVENVPYDNKSVANPNAIIYKMKT